MVYDCDAGHQGFNLFVYCGNNPISRIDISGADSELLDVEDADDQFEPILEGSSSNGYPSSPYFSTVGFSGSGMQTSGRASLWADFEKSLGDALNGLSMASGDKTSNYAYYSERHHFVSNKSKKYTPLFQEITDRYGLSLNDRWNTGILNGHRGRHTNKYHEFVLEGLYAIDAIAGGGYSEFMYGFGIFRQFLSDNPWIMYRK